MAPVTPTTSSTPSAQKASAVLAPDQLKEIAPDAYIYAYPLVIMEMTRRVITNVADIGQFGKAPMNQFANVPAFPDASFTDVVRPNADTLYSILWFDVSKEPLRDQRPRFGRPLLPAADARHVDRRVRIARQAHDRHRRADVRDLGPRGRASCPTASSSSAARPRSAG